MSIISVVYLLGAVIQNRQECFFEVLLRDARDAIY